MCTGKEKIKQAFQCPDGEVFFLVGGTQTNQVIISTMLAPYEGVIAAKTGHVSVHEAGAIEYSGHKVIELEENDGKLAAEDIKKCIEDFIQTIITNIWYILEWFISHFLQNMEHCIRNRN